MRKELRDYQEDMLKNILENIDKNSLNVLVPGGGKTLVMSRLAEYLVNLGKKVVVLSMSITVREQLRQAFIEDGVEVEFSSSLVHEKNAVKEVDAFIIDEAHHAVADSFLELFERFPEAKRYGFTATATREDKRGLGDVFDIISKSPVTTKELISRGILSRFKYYAPSNSSIRSTAVSDKHLLVNGNQYAIASGGVPKDRTIYGDIIKTWKTKAGNGYKTILFAPSVEASREYAKSFNKAGVKTTFIDSSLGAEENADRIRSFRAGKYDVICNYDMISEGFDMSEVDCVILTHTTMSYRLFYQRVFRAMRANGNRVAVVLDHGDNVSVHGKITEFRDYTLAKSDDIEDAEARERDFERLGADWGYFENRGVELVEVYRYGKNYDSKYDKLIERANELGNLEGLMLLFEIQGELGIRSAGNAPAWAYAYARSKGYRDVPEIS